MDFLIKKGLLIKTMSICHPILTIFLMPVLLGESGVFFVSILSTQGFFPISLVVAVTYIGTFAGEVFWFLLGRSGLFHGLEKWIVRRGVSDTFARFTKHINPQHPFKTLILTRFISGLSIPAIIYLSRKGTSLKKFISTSLMVNLVWTPTVTLIGWLAGQGFTILLHIFKDIELALTVFVIAGVITLIAEKELKSYLFKKKNFQP